MVRVSLISPQFSGQLSIRQEVSVRFRYLLENGARAAPIVVGVDLPTVTPEMENATFGLDLLEGGTSGNVQ
jgi:hypothetical protein